MIATKNMLLVSTATNTYAVDLPTRTQVWSYPAGGHLTLSAQGILFIAQSTGKLSAISVR
jgi:outer membrane protein assembly factor BamB